MHRFAVQVPMMISIKISTIAAMVLSVPISYAGAQSDSLQQYAILTV